MSRELRNRYDGVNLPLIEMDILSELEASLRDSGSLIEDDFIPPLAKDQPGGNESKIGFYAENNSIVTLSLRYCELKTLPESLGHLSNLQH